MKKEKGMEDDLCCDPVLVAQSSWDKRGKGGGEGEDGGEGDDGKEERRRREKLEMGEKRRMIVIKGRSGTRNEGKRGVETGGEKIWEEKNRFYIYECREKGKVQESWIGIEGLNEGISSKGRGTMSVRRGAMKSEERTFGKWEVSLQ